MGAPTMWAHGKAGQWTKGASFPTEARCSGCRWRYFDGSNFCSYCGCVVRPKAVQAEPTGKGKGQPSVTPPKTKGKGTYKGAVLNGKGIGGTQAAAPAPAPQLPIPARTSQTRQTAAATAPNASGATEAQGGNQGAAQAAETAAAAPATSERPPEDLEKAYNFLLTLLGEDDPSVTEAKERWQKAVQARKDAEAKKKAPPSLESKVHHLSVRISRIQKKIARSDDHVLQQKEAYRLKLDELAEANQRVQKAEEEAQSVRESLRMAQEEHATLKAQIRAPGDSKQAAENLLLTVVGAEAATALPEEARNKLQAVWAILSEIKQEVQKHDKPDEPMADQTPRPAAAEGHAATAAHPAAQVEPQTGPTPTKREADTPRSAPSVQGVENTPKRPRAAKQGGTAGTPGASPRGKPCP